MATSGSTDFELDVTDYIEEAFERCGKTVRTGYDLKTAKRSLNLLLAEWANRGLNQWTIDQTTINLATNIRIYPGGTLTMSVAASANFTVGETLTGGTSGATCQITSIPSATSFAITIPTGTFSNGENITGGTSGTVTTLSAAVDFADVQSTIDILSVALRRDNTDYSIPRVSRDDYLTIPNKSTTGRVSQFFLNRLITPQLEVWPTPDNDTDLLIFNRLTRIQDADTFINTFEVPFRFYPCLAAGLAYYLSVKIAQDRTPMLKALYEEEFDKAAVEDRDRASFTIQPGYAGLRFNS
jgi:hypothetical protein|tara:strand:- start:363 stop:1253 length:891 start_codon:yes stop_codon:yes gene_type:complete